MVLRNFKSYAGEQRIGPFHKVCFSLPQARALASFYFDVLGFSTRGMGVMAAAGGTHGVSALPLSDVLVVLAADLTSRP
jgi:hypothetical protein